MTDKYDDVAPILPRAADISVPIHGTNNLFTEEHIINHSLGRMSPTRQNFCVFVLFNFLLVSFLWLILAMVDRHGDWKDILNNEIKNYTIYSSFFDLVILAVSRFALLELFYGLLKFKRKFIIVFTTLSSCCFLTSKIIFFDWNNSNQTALQCTALLVCFVLPWMEVWYLTGRVLTKEKMLQDAAMQYCDGRSGNATNSDEPNRFFTPVESESDSDDGDSRRKRNENPALILMEALKLKMQLTDWEFLKNNKKCQVHFQKIDGCYKLQFQVRADIDRVSKVVFYDLDSIKTWNKMLENCTLVRNLDCGDILYQVIKASRGFSQRDLVVRRHFCTIGNFRAVAVASTDDAECPLRSGIIRAQVKHSGWTIREQPRTPGVCEVIGYFSMDLRLSLPLIVFKTAFASSLLEIGDAIITILSENSTEDS